MKTTIHSTKYAKQRRFFLILPLLTLPFLTMMFWAFGGGSGNHSNAESNNIAGLNLKLPDAYLKEEKALTKLGFYDQADLDSVKTEEAEKLDPYLNKHADDLASTNGYTDSLSNGSNGLDPNQAKVYSKLDELKKALSKSQQASNNIQQPAYHSYTVSSAPSSNDVERLQAMMQRMKEGKAEDPDIVQLNDMLDKIKAIQNPEQADKNISSNSKNLPVKIQSNQADISLLKRDPNQDSKTDTNINGFYDNAFYSSDISGFDNDSNAAKAIEAVIPETQTIVTGATIKLALINDVIIHDVVLPAGTLIYGTASLTNERLKTTIKTIRFQNEILPVALDVYDMDGLEGIYMPGSIGRTVSKESADNAVSGMNLTTFDPSLGAQAASAGIAAAKTLFSKKIRLIKMTVKAGYKVLLKDSRSK